MEEKKEIIDMLIQRETFYRCNEDGSFSKVDLVNEFYEDICKELDRAREEWTEELRQAFYDTFYKSGELWFDYIFEDGDTKAEQNAKEVVEEYWKEILSKLTTK